MMNRINLFVACPKDSDALKDQKAKIKEYCLELNKAFALVGKRVKLNPVTYENPERREEMGQIHIKNKADIVIFLIDNNQDKVLANELKMAVDRSNKFHKPELLVFASKKSKENKGFYQEIKKILADGGWLSEPFDDTEDLLDRVREKVLRYIRSENSIKNIRRWSMLRYYGLWVAIPLLIIFGILLVCRPFLRDKFESRQLLIMGGGSAINYIVEHAPSLKSKEDLNTMRLHYAAMASGNSYGLIAEEVIKNYDGYKRHPYYPIVLSAKQATEDDFLRSFSPQDFQKTGIVIGIKMGEDWLVAYGNKGAFDKEMLISDTAIRDTSLTKIIADQVSLLKEPLDSTTNIKRVFVYTTNENSGTLNSYLNTCDNALIKEYFKICGNLKIERPPFSDIDTLPKQKDASNWIALGSKYYHPSNKVMDSLTVVVMKEGGLQVQTKLIYVYFMLYYNPHNGLYVLPKATKKFLKKIQLPDTTIDSLNNPETISRIINDSTILYDTIFKIHKTKND